MYQGSPIVLPPTYKGRSRQTATLGSSRKSYLFFQYSRLLLLRSLSQAVGRLENTSGPKICHYVEPSSVLRRRRWHSSPCVHLSCEKLCQLRAKYNAVQEWLVGFFHHWIIYSTAERASPLLGKFSTSYPPILHLCETVSRVKWNVSQESGILLGSDRYPKSSTRVQSSQSR